MTSVDIPSSVTKIGGYAFMNCFRLTSIEFPNSVATMGERVLLGCERLTSVVLPEGMTEIGEMFFKGCTRLSTLEIPALVATIGNNVFEGCTSLSRLTLTRETPPTLGTDVFLNVPSDLVVAVPYSAANAYKAATGWEDMNISFSQVDITDGENYTNVVSADNVAIAYSRTFKNEAWQPLYVPFSLSYGEWSAWADVAKVSGVHEYDDGTTIIEFRTVTSGSTNANTPYLIRAKQSSDNPVTLTLSNRQLFPAESNSVWCASTERRYTLTGIYEAQDNLTGSLVMSGGTFYSVASPTTTLKAQRFYLSITDEDHGYGGGITVPGTPLQAPQRIGVMVDGETTGIEFTAPARQEGAAYNLGGQRVGQGYKGIVIKGGKKIVKQ